MIAITTRPPLPPNAYRVTEQVFKTRKLTSCESQPNPLSNSLKLPIMTYPQVTMLYPLIMLLLLSRVSAHGFISWPRQRGLLGENDFKLKPLSPDAPPDFCPHCLNGGGTGSIKRHIPGGKWTPYEPTDLTFPFRDDHGLCGDPKGKNDHMAGGKFYTGFTVATYEQGDYIDMEAHVSAHHNGYFEFFACSLDCCGEDDLSQKCFTDNCCEKLKRVPHQSCETGRDRVCGPVDPLYPGRWYLPPRGEKNGGDNWYGGLNKKIRYALPKGMACEKCVIHWSWTTANSCNPPGYADYNFPKRWQGIPGDGGSVGGINRAFATCGDDGSSFPEEFWSCSENVRIVKNNGGTDRTAQIFHNGDMNIEGPDNSTSSELTQPMKKPVMVPVLEDPEVEDPSPTPSPPKSTDTTNATPEEEDPSPTPSPPQSTNMTNELLEGENPIPTPSPPQSTNLTNEMLEGENPSPSPSPTQSSNMTIAVGAPQNGTETLLDEIPMETSSYNLSLFVRSYDTGTCLARDESEYCQACLDLGYGVTKCFWCTRDSIGQETCLHEMP